MKFGIFVHPTRPKMPLADILKVVRSAGLSYSKSEPDVAIVVGGDGTFGYYGRTLSIPMLFVGVKERNILGSKARRAEIFYDNLGKALKDIETGKYRIDEERMLSVNCNGNKADILTDVYLERGIFAGCLRYAISVEDKTRSRDSASKTCFTEYAIGNGVIVSTPFGSGGYYSYADRMKVGSWSNRSIKLFGANRIGICHILPLFLVRVRNGRKQMTDRARYTVPSQSVIKINLMREADARLYGTTKSSKGIPIGISDKVIITQSNKTAQIIRLKSSYR